MSHRNQLKIFTLTNNTMIRPGIDISNKLTDDTNKQTFMYIGCLLECLIPLKNRYFKEGFLEHLCSCNR